MRCSISRTESRYSPSCAVGVTDAGSQPLGLGANGVEDAARLASTRQALVRRATVAEQPFEHDARVILGEVRRRLVAPRYGVHVETVAGIAGALRRRIHGELERAHARGPPKHLGRQLIGARGELHLHAGPRAVPGMHAGQPGRGRSRVIARAVAEVLGLRMVETAQHGELAAQRGERPQHRRQLELRTLATRLEGPMHDSVADVNEAEARNRRRDIRAEGGYHCIEQRQSHRGADAAQERPPRHGLFADMNVITPLPSRRRPLP
jgi:hypothetical protein